MEKWVWKDECKNIEGFRGVWSIRTCQSVRAWTCPYMRPSWPWVLERRMRCYLMEWGARAGEHRQGNDIRAQLCLLMSMALHKSARTWPSPLVRRLLALAEDASLLRTCFARSLDRFPMEGSPCWLSIDGSATTIWSTASTPWWAKATNGEYWGTRRWIDSVIVWSQTTLKYGLRFRTTLLLGVHASDASDPLIIGYHLKLLWEAALPRPTMLIRWASMAEFQ
jgi:hypothetical protein